MRNLGSLAALALAAGALGCGSGRPAAVAPAAPPGDERDGREVLEQGTADGPPAAARGRVENPQYTSWARFPKRTAVVHKTVTETAGQPSVTVTTTTSTLTDLTPERAVVTVQAHTRRYDGHEANNPPDRFTFPKLMPLPPGVAPADFGKPTGADKQGEETVRVGGKEYRARWHEGQDHSEAGEVLSKVWTSDAVPGGLVKSVTRTPGVGKTTTIELVAVRVP
jgi:hypothetical protein